MLQLRGNQQLIFRSYVIIAFGVISLGLLLDWVLVHALQEDEELEYQPWLNSTFSLVENRLQQTPGEDWNAEIQRLTQQLAMPIHVLSSDDIAAGSSAAAAELRAGEIVTYYTADSSRLFYKRLSQHDKIVSLGPLPRNSQQSANQWLRVFVPLLFYTSIFLLVWVWIRPLIRDLDTLSAAAETLQHDHRQSIADVSNITTIRPLADSFQAMTQRLSTLLASQQEFTNALSHELRTPLARIKFGLELLKDDVPANADARLQNVRQDVQEIDELVSTMLDYARLEHADLEIHWQGIPAQQLLNATVNKFRPWSGPVSIEVVNEVGHGEVECDPYLMGLSLSNFLSNALRYAKSSVRIRFARLDQSWRLQVDDDGLGVPVDKRGEILKAFARLDDHADRDSGGYGLGLAIVNRIAGLHGGSVSVDQSPLGGAKFTLCWPAKHLA